MRTGVAARGFCRTECLPATNCFARASHRSAIRHDVRLSAKETTIVTICRQISRARPEETRPVRPFNTRPGKIKNGDRRSLGLRSGRGYAGEAERLSVAAHGGDAEADVSIHIEAQFLCPLQYVFAMDTACESLIFHLLTHALNIHVEDGPGRFYQRDRG